MERVLKLLAVRKFIDNNMPEGIYLDVMQRVLLPSYDGDYSQYDAVIICNAKEQKEKIQKIDGISKFSIKILFI